MPQFVSTCVSTVLLTGPFIACFFILESKVAKYLFNSLNIWQHYKETEQILLLNEPKGHSPPEVFIFVSLFPKSQRCLSQPWLISVWGDNVLCTWGQACEPGKGMKPTLIRETWWTFSTALNHQLNRQHAVIGADIGRSVLSGDFNSLQHTILVYLDLMDMPFLPSPVSMCLLPFLFGFGAVHKNMCLNKCVCFKWVWICLFKWVCIYTNT